ncbi:MAG: geranylgeranylglyceryl/heptaprenylglyceryl phosphate synthase [Haliscomenobacter sp.]|nr:geranylgeranylglyceryl/heptaprenylglyceryl phosphate synthase [Haliscomenobacter sp.]MBK8879679.1 geranylgeranylglyceryl/heptaprenylglyceryl phosphate synthase [Haliscomenobacter sp.]
MPPQPIYSRLIDAQSSGEKLLAVLIDPDRLRVRYLTELLEIAQACAVDFFFVGGSLLVQDELENCVQTIRQHSAVPVVLFPGNPLQINKTADAILLLSLISGRNPEFLIGQHVVAAPYLKASQLEIIPTGYALIDGGKPTTVSYISNTAPIPANKPEIAVCTAMAGEMLGLKAIYLDSGSGAMNPVPEATIREVRQAVALPLVVGGGLRTPGQVRQSLLAGADLAVVGGAIEKDPKQLPLISEAVKSLNK